MYVPERADLSIRKLLVGDVQYQHVPLHRQPDRPRAELVGDVCDLIHLQRRGESPDVDVQCHHLLRLGAWSLFWGRELSRALPERALEAGVAIAFTEV